MAGRNINTSQTSWEAGVAIPEEVFERDAVVGWRRKLGGGRRWDSALHAAAAAAAAAPIS
jgi:hypothetical protein